MKKPLTTQDLHDYCVENDGRAYNTIEWALKQQEFKCPSKPTKPLLLRTHTVSDAKLYAKQLEEYETVTYPKYVKLLSIYNEEKNNIGNCITEFIKEASGLNTIPEEYRDKVYSKAYNDGQGFSEIFNRLVSLVEIFN